MNKMLEVWPPLTYNFTETGISFQFCWRVRLVFNCLDHAERGYRWTLLERERESKINYFKLFSYYLHIYIVSSCLLPLKLELYTGLFSNIFRFEASKPFKMSFERKSPFFGTPRESSDKSFSYYVRKTFGFKFFRLYRFWVDRSTFEEIHSVLSIMLRKDVSEIYFDWHCYLRFSHKVLA